jgi:hypothetical protein
MTAEERAATAPLIPPEDVVQVVLQFVTDDSLNGCLAVLEGGAAPQLLDQRGSVVSES